MSEPHADDEMYSPDEMRDWLKVEIAAVRMTSVRRIKQARAIVEEYAAGVLSRADANRRLNEHESKWGEVAQDTEIAAEVHDAAVSKVYRLTRSDSYRKDTRGWSR